MNTTPVYVFAKWLVNENSLTEVLTLMKEVAAQSREEEGCLLYNIHQSNTVERVILLYEGYVNQAAVEEHRNTPHFRDIVLKKIVPLLAEREVTLTTAPLV